MVLTVFSTRMVLYVRVALEALRASLGVLCFLLDITEIQVLKTKEMVKTPLLAAAGDVTQLTVPLYLRPSR